MTNKPEAPERIWAKVVLGWHDGETGEDFVGGEFDAGHFKDGVEYIRADLHTAAIAELVEGLREQERFWLSLADDTAVQTGINSAPHREALSVLDGLRALIAKYEDTQ